MSAAQIELLDCYDA